MIYSKTLVTFLNLITMKLKGAYALYRLRSLIKSVGKSTRCPISVEIKVPEKVLLGDHVSIGPYSTIGGYGGVEIQDYVRISKGVTIESAGLILKGELPYKHIGKPIIIKRGAWLGTRCIILAGVTIGEKAIVGAGVIVSKDVKDNEVIVSQPFRILEQR